VSEKITILSINKGHNASSALLKDGEIVSHIENERLSNIKYDTLPFKAIDFVTKGVEKIDYLAIAGMSPPRTFDAFSPNDIYTEYVLKLSKSFFNNNLKVMNFWDNHHELHAACAFYNSGFETALCVIKDGMGSEVFSDKIKEGFFGRETGTSFVASYPNNFEVVDKSVAVSYSLEEEKYFIDKNTYLTNSFSEGLVFETIAKEFGFHPLDAGKVMGMSSYGEKILNFETIYKNGLPDKKYFYFENSLVEHRSVFKNNKDFFENANLAYQIQKQTEDSVIEYILKMIEKTNEKNVCLSGGYFLNCVANYKIKKRLPKDVNLYIEPISNDSGTSIGAAKKLYYLISESNKAFTQKNIFYGPYPKYNLEKIKKENKVFNVTSKDVAEKISLKKIVAIYQGGSESGPRALGNRSILYDPRDIDGKNVVNAVKKREWFRPFAGSVLVEHAKEWFDMAGLEESPFMMYAVDVLENKKSFIPAITHVDGTCRIQTLSYENNPYFYNLIYEFYKITNVPILFNTSFNLAGDCIVENIDQAIETFKNSEIDYLYLPDLKIMIGK
jgi:carbamoyltransferase